VIVRRLIPAAVALALSISSLLGPAWPALGQSADSVVLPAPPRVFLDTSYTPPSGRTIAVAAGADLQAALRAAQPGDVITLEPGAVYAGNFSLPRKSGAAWIVVRSGAPADKLPAPGTRVTPAFAPAMPKIVSQDSNPAVSTEPGAHHYRFIGVEVTAAASVKAIYSIVSFGGEQRTEAETPHSLILDRCYVHGHPQLASRRGVLLNSASSAVIDSYVSEIHTVGADSQAILGYNGPGPFKIVNNFLEGAAENIMFGGADPKIPGLVPSDIEIRGNHLFKPMSWRPGHPTFAGVQWTVKNLLELKNAQRVLIEGNLLENVWSTALVLTPRNQDGRAPWSLVRDVLFRNNIVKNAISGFVVQSTDDEGQSQPTKRIAIVNNLWLGFTRTFFGMSTSRGTALDDLLIDHNTAIPGGYSAYYIEAGAALPAIVRFQMTNNLIGFGAFGGTFPRPDANLGKWLPGAVIAKNALVNLADTADGQGAARNRPPEINQAMYSSFRDAAAAGINADGTLTAKSPNRRAGTDGKDIGVDFSELQRAMTGYFLHP
jgi:hypothetical protein